MNCIYYLIAINIITFIVYGIDKLKAKRKAWRISEATLLSLAVIGGSIGALFGMYAWHHKTKHLKFFTHYLFCFGVQAQSGANMECPLF